MILASNEPEHPEETSDISAPTEGNEKILDLPGSGRSLTRYSVVPEALLTFVLIGRHRILTLAVFMSTAFIQGTPKSSNLLTESSHGVGTKSSSPEVLELTSSGRVNILLKLKNTNPNPRFPSPASLSSVMR